MNPSFLAQEPWGWTPEQVGRVSFVTATRLYYEPARKASKPAPASGSGGWDWSKGIPPRGMFVGDQLALGKSQAEAEATWERLNRGQANRG